MYNQLIICIQNEPVKQYLDKLIVKQKLNHRQVVQINQDQDSILINQIRQITQLVAREYAQKTLFLIWNFGSASSVVQNAFLKTLEEHQPNVIFVLVSKTVGSILPTIQSRCQIKYLTAENQKILPSKERELATIIEKAQKTPRFLLSSYLNLKPKGKKEQALLFLEELLNYLNQQIISSKQRQSLAVYTKRALDAKSLIETNNVDPEIALDQVFSIN